MADNCELKVWAEPAKRPNMRLHSGDIQEALVWFQKDMGQDARLIILNPKNERFAEEVDNGIEVQYVGGCLLWEVWLSSSENVAPPRVNYEFSADEDVNPDFSANGDTDSSFVTPSPPQSLTNRRNKNKGDGKARGKGRGRPAREVPTDKIEELKAQGLGVRAIAQKLEDEEGIRLSFMTVHRVTKRQDNSRTK